ncbi:hypothetical protein [Streptomyces capitiformicae]|uniref:Uncharacterized protein n=1 Tax=Streptomyces capitiformicae TaxID=2014920 RepID=A0A919DMM9_9ACTN|nr:hypothetical protein [Streptomyces capitiformicae]GHE60623.1 hypothetical protein GCM10017771_83790 [Streptomyces capitiformicae]
MPTNGAVTKPRARTTRSRTPISEAASALPSTLLTRCGLGRSDAADDKGTEKTAGPGAEGTASAATYDGHGPRPPGSAAKPAWSLDADSFAAPGNPWKLRPRIVGEFQGRPHRVPHVFETPYPLAPVPPCGSQPMARSCVA